MHEREDTKVHGKPKFSTRILLGLSVGVAAMASPVYGSLSSTELAGFRGRIDEIVWTLPPDDVATLTASPDIDLVAMGRWAQNYLVNNSSPSLHYACRFSLEWRCPPPKIEEELTAHVPGALYCGGVPPDKIYISPWATGNILVSLAETFARTGDQAAKQQARQLFVALRGLASQDGERAWYPGCSGPYLDGKWYDTFVSVNYGCQTEPVLRYAQLTGDGEALEFARPWRGARSMDLRPWENNRETGMTYEFRRTAQYQKT